MRSTIKYKSEGIRSPREHTNLLNPSKYAQRNTVCSNKSENYTLVTAVRLLSEYRKSYYCYDCAFVTGKLAEFTASNFSTKLARNFQVFLVFQT